MGARRRRPPIGNVGSGGEQRHVPGARAGTVRSRLAPIRHSQFTKAVRRISGLLRNHQQLFTVTTNLKHRAVLMTAYAAGLRASELGRLQLSDVDSARMCLRVDQGKGNKDRYVPLSPRLLEQLREYWRRDRP